MALCFTGTLCDPLNASNCVTPNSSFYLQEIFTLTFCANTLWSCRGRFFLLVHFRDIQTFRFYYPRLIDYVQTEIKRLYSYRYKVKTFKYLGSLLTNQNSIHEEIKFRFKAGSSYYYSVQITLSSQLLSNNLKIKIHKKIILPVVLHGSET